MLAAILAAVASAVAACLVKLGWKTFTSRPSPEVQLATTKQELQATDAEDLRVQRAVAAGDRAAAVGLRDPEADARAPDPDSRD